MNYLIEALFVGLYTSVLYLLVSRVIKDFMMILLVTGFLKHSLASSIGIWTWYCNNGTACKKELNQNENYESTTVNIVRDSIYESMLFVVVGMLLSIIMRKNVYLFLVLGIILHIWGEMFGIHTIFCRKQCKHSGSRFASEFTKSN